MAELLKAREADGMRKRYLGDLRVRLGRFEKDFGARSIATITGPEADSWLRGLPDIGAVTRNSFRRRLHTLFSFALFNGWIAENPIAKIRKLKETDAEPGILTPRQFAALLGVASFETLPFWALGGFAGLRSAELRRLDWDDISFEQKFVAVPANKSKTGRSRRLIPLRPNLEAWLKPYKARSGPIAPPNLRRLLEADRVRAGLSSWAPNSLRHSFASYALAHWNDAPKLSLELGHRNPDLLFSHYRALVTPKAAKAYWSIVPQPSNKIVALAG